VEERIFAEQLQDFYTSVPDIVSTGNEAFRLDVLYFPALLFQIAALALMFVPECHDKALDDLCAGNSFESLSKRYGENTVAILSLIGKDNPNMMSVQTGLLRACWLKYVLQVTESWQAMGEVVKATQEIGLHLHTLPEDLGSYQDVCHQLWPREMRRRLMLNIFLWDQ
jgi:hypothetical protein